MYHPDERLVRRHIGTRPGKGRHPKSKGPRETDSFGDGTEEPWDRNKTIRQPVTSPTVGPLVEGPFTEIREGSTPLS